MFFRARAANRIGHQPPKLAICEFESHRAFHPAIAQWQSTRLISGRRGFDFLSRDHSGLAQQVVRSAVNREDLRSSRRAGAKFRERKINRQSTCLLSGDAGSSPGGSHQAGVAQSAEHRSRKPATAVRFRTPAPNCGGRSSRGRALDCESSMMRLRASPVTPGFGPVAQRTSAALSEGAGHRFKSDQGLQSA